MFEKHAYLISDTQFHQLNSPLQRKKTEWHPEQLQLQQQQQEEQCHCQNGGGPVGGHTVANRGHSSQEEQCLNDPTISK